MNLTLRVVGNDPKLAPLTHTEVDYNFLEVSSSVAQVANSSLVAASLSADVLRFRKGDGSTFDVDFREFVIEPETGSLYLSSSIDLNGQTLLFRKGNGADDIIDLSGFVTQNESGSLMYSASLDFTTNVFTFYRDNGNYTIDISELTGLTLHDAIVSGSFTGSFEGVGSGSFSGSFEGIGSGSFSGSFEGSAEGLFTGVGSGSFSGSFEGDGSGLTGVGLDHTVSSGLGIESFTFDGGSDQIVTLDTGSVHFTEGARKKFGVVSTTGALGINMSYDEATGTFSGSLANSTTTLANTTIDLGGSTSVVDGLQLTDTNATGSFTGSFEGDFILSKNVSNGSGIQAFNFNGETDQIVTLDTGSTHFTEGVREKINVTDTTGASGVDLTYDEATGNIQATLVNSSTTFGNTTVALGGSSNVIDGLQLTDVNATGSFSGSFEGDFILSKNVSNGSGIEAFSFDGQADQIVTLATGSTHFTEGVREKINVTDTTGASGVDLTYDEATGNIQATLVNSAVTLGTSTVDLGGTLTTVDGIQLTDVDATGSFSGLFTGDFTLSKNISNGLGLETFSFDGQTNQVVNLATGSLHFTDGVKKKLNTDGVYSASIQINHDATTNFVANEHIDHTDVDITAGLGMLGGGDISVSRTLTLDTGSAHFNNGIKAKLNAEGLLSGSSAITSTSQGTLTYTSNGVSTNVDLGVETTDNVVFGSVAVNATLNSTAILQADSTTKGFLPPRMTKVQREAINTPATGLMVYQTDGTVSVDSPFGTSTIEMKGLWYYDGASWQGPLTT